MNIGMGEEARIIKYKKFRLFSFIRTCTIRVSFSLTKKWSIKAKSWHFSSGNTIPSRGKRSYPGCIPAGGTSYSICTVLSCTSQTISSLICLRYSQGWEFALRFSWVNCSFFAKQWANNERISDLLKKQAIRSFAHLLIFGDWPERFAHITHFW